MTERETLEAAAGTLEQVFVLLSADLAALDREIAALSAFPAQSVPRSEKDAIYQTRYDIQRAIKRNRLTYFAITRKLDPFGDLYLFQPGLPVTLTPGGIIPSITGYCNYLDPVTVQAIPADTPTVLVIDPQTVNETQKPADVTTFLSDNKIVAKEGDAIDIRVQMRVRPTSDTDTATSIKVWFVISNVLTSTIFPHDLDLDGYDVPKLVSYNTAAYVGAQWAANGANIVVQANGPVEVTSRNLLVTRLHKGTPT